MRPIVRAVLPLVVVLVAFRPALAAAQLLPWNWGGAGTAPAAAQEWSSDAFADYLGSGHPPHPAVVRIVAPENGGTSMGSGALVDVNATQGLVLTNWHVIRGAKSAVLVQFPDGFQTAGTVIRHDEPWDLAAVAIWRPKVTPIPLSPVPPAIGEPLSILGYGKGPFRSETGPCTQYLAPGTGYPLEFVELRARARQGDSGGPILNARGELAGILFGQGQGHTIGSCSTRVRTFLASVGSAGITPEAAAAMAAAPVPGGPSVGPGAFPVPPVAAVAGTAVGNAAGDASGSVAVIGAAPVTVVPAPGGPAGPTSDPIAVIAGVPRDVAAISESAPPTPVAEIARPTVVGDAVPVPPVTVPESVSVTIGPPPPAWGDLPEGRPVGRTVGELLDPRVNGQALLVAAGGAALALVGLRTVFGGRRAPSRRHRRDPYGHPADFEGV